MLVMDNPDTYCAASIYEAFEPEEASRLRKRFEFHYAPKHGSWLNMAKIEIGVMSRQCPGRRIPDRETMCREVAAYVRDRNERAKTVNWRFMTGNVRIKLKSLYPSFQKS